VRGALVSVLRDNGTAIDTTLTEEAGQYHFPAVVNSDASGALVSVAREGYLIETAYVLVPQAERVFDLEPAEHIQVGQVVRSAVLDDRCASFGYGGGNGSLCRRFAMMPEASGTLQITASGGTPGTTFDLAVLNQQGTITGYSSRSELSLPVNAGLTYQIDVVPIGSREFALTTSLR
jgi:hypothetical protein